uniref:G-protein coupled receptors family 1 profile domain-containing protein n=2 Tax=Latimeria chalumnae TaxID=7897 RepID=H3BD69_LATCH
VVPLILLAIFSNRSIRQETRYLLLGNAMLCDILYLMLYTSMIIINTVDLIISKLACLLMFFLLGVAYCGGIFTTAAKLVDVYLAVLWPLHYASLLPPSRAKKLVLSTWIISCLLPSCFFAVFWLNQEPMMCPVEACSVPMIIALALSGRAPAKLSYLLFMVTLLVCLFLVLCGYIMIYLKTRESGIWNGFSSRASGTFLMHYILLFFYFCPILVMVVETLLILYRVTGLQTGLWVTLTICNVLMVLPKALSPYMYGLRYRELSRILQAFLKLKPLNSVS